MSRQKGQTDIAPRKMGPGAEYITEKLEFLQAVAPTAPLDWTDHDELSNRFVRYLTMCKRYGAQPGNMTAYFALGINREDIVRILNGRGGTPAFRECIQMILRTLSAYREQAMQDGAINPIVGIWNQKAHDGLSEKSDNFAADPLGERQTIAALRDRYLPGETAGRVVDADAVEDDDGF